MDRRALIREIARIGILASILYLFISLGVLLAGFEHRHAYIMLYSALLLFPHSVALVYVASGAMNDKRVLNIVYMASIITIFMFFAPLAGLWLNWKVPTATFLVISAIMAVASALGGASKRESLKISLFLVSSSYIITVITIATMILSGWPSKFSIAATALTLAYPITLIYSVTVHSLPSTFRDKPISWLSYLLPITSGSGSILVALRYMKVGAIVASIGMILYIFASRMYRLRVYLKGLERLDRKSAAYRGSSFFVNSHYVVIASVLLAFIDSILLYTGYCNLLCFLHCLAMGFVSVHVFIHAPMMLPVVLKVRHKRRYNLSPQVLALIAATIWPLSGITSYFIYIAAFVLDVLIVL